MYKNKVIVFNCSYNGLSIIQELNKVGIECIAMDCFRGIGTYSRYASKFIKCEDPRYNEKVFVDQLYEYCKQQDYKPVLFPTNDEWALAVSRQRDRLETVAHVCSSNSKSVELILNKDKFYEIGNKANYMTPYTWENDKLCDITSNTFPVVAKAKFKSIPDGDSEELNKSLEENRLVVLNSRKELNEYVDSNQELLPYLVFQEYVRGNSDAMYTVGIYADRDNKIRALFTGRKVRGYPAEFGDNIVGESCNVPEDLIENVQKIVNELSYSGIAEFEYKKDEVSGEYKLIEINPRSWSWIGISPHCGVNIPLIAYKDLTNLDTTTTTLIQNEEKVRYIKVFQDFVNCLFRYKKSFPEWAMNLREWNQDLKFTKNVYAELYRKDYMVTFVSIFYVLAKTIKQRK